MPACAMPSAMTAPAASWPRFLRVSLRIVASPSRGLEQVRRNHLAALEQPVLVWLVVGHGVVDGADVVPHEHVPHAPAVGVLVLVLGLVLEQPGQHLVALGGA